MRVGVGPTAVPTPAPASGSAVDLWLANASLALPRGVGGVIASPAAACCGGWPGPPCLGCPHSSAPLTVVTPLPGLQHLPLAFQTAGDAGEGLLIFGMDIATLQQWTLIYLGISSLAFVLVWLIGFLRR